MRKIISLLLTVLTVIPALALISCGALRDNNEYAVVSEGNLSSDGFYYTLYENGAVTLTGRNGSEKQMTVPDKLDGHPVTAIGKSAFNGNTTIKYVTLGANVRRIDSDAFAGCQALVRVDATDALREIGDSAFYACPILTEVNGVGKLEKIGVNAFGQCPSLCRFEFAGTLELIDEQAFFGCTGLTSVILPKKDCKLGHDVFSYCESITYVSLGGLTVIPGCAFECCSSLVRVDGGESVVSIGESAFRGCVNLVDLKIGKKVATIEPSAFDGSAWIELQKDEFVIVGKGILIRYNGTDTNVAVPSGVRIIADAFCGNETIRSITIPGKTEKIGDYAFSGCTNLNRVSVGGKVTEIGACAFSSCTSLTAISLPKSLTYVGVSAFYNCESLITVDYAGNASAWDKIKIERSNDYLIIAAPGNNG